MDLVGAWRLERWVSRRDDGQLLLPGGEHPSGDLIYTGDGRFSAQLADDGRPLLGTMDPRGGSAAAQAQAYATYVAYCGTYDIDADYMVHAVEMCTLPDWVGTRQRRRIHLDADTLTLSTPMEIRGVNQVLELVWARR